MTSRYKNLFQQRTWVKHTLSIILLFFLWLFLTFWYIIIFDQSVLVISYGHGKDSFAKFTNHKILRGELVSGQFVAIDDNLGIVALRFQSSQRVPYEQEDSLLFRLKEKGTSQWYYENTYRSTFSWQGCMPDDRCHACYRQLRRKFS